MLIKSKKAFVEAQFNWIFIIIAGGMILLFFFSVVNKQKEVSDIKITGTIRSDLRAILTGSKVSTGTASLIDTSEIKLSYDCNGYSIGKLSPIRPKNSFSPSLIKGYGLMAWALDWNMPYRVTNFLYFTSNQIRYIIVDDSGNFAEQLNETFPPREIIQNEKVKILIDREFVSDLGTVKDRNNYKVRFIFFNQDPLGGLLDLINMKDKDVTAIQISPGSSDLFGYGTIQFFEKSDNNWGTSKGTSYYIGKASLIGAVFTDEIETYNCNMKRAFEDLSIVSSIYINRTKTLKDFYNHIGSICGTPHGSALTPLNDIKSKADDLSLNFPYSIDPVQELSQKALVLVSFNEGAQKLSCEEIY